MKRTSRKSIWIGAAALLLAPSLAAAQGPYYYGAPAYVPPHGAALGPWPWNFDFGGGPTSVVGDTSHSLTGGWNFTFGGGYNVTPRAGFIFEFMQSGLGLTNSELQRNQAFDGDANVWSFTLNPIWRFRLAGPVGGYLIGGGGFYEREERMAVPGQVFVPTFSGGFFAPGVVEVHTFDDTGGVNVGAGLTCNMGWGTKFFVEARYHYLFTSGTPTQIIPVTFGFRW